MRDSNCMYKLYFKQCKNTINTKVIAGSGQIVKSYRKLQRSHYNVETSSLLLYFYVLNVIILPLSILLPFHLFLSIPDERSIVSYFHSLIQLPVEIDENDSRLDMNRLRFN